MTVSSRFNPATGVLTATGDNHDNTITVSHDAAGAILINDGAVPIVGGTPNVANTTQIQLSGRGGDDVITADSSSTVPVTIDGGAGDDTITGGGGADILYAGAGNDIVTGGRGNDTAFLGAGNDRFIWNPGDGSDVVEGQSGFDTLVFNGSNVGENIDISADGERATLFRKVGNVTMDLNGVERIELAAKGSADNITVNDLTGTDVKQVAIDLTGNGAGDDAPDTVTVNGTGGNDRINVAISGASVVVKGLSAQVTIDGAEASNDSLVNKFEEVAYDPTHSKLKEIGPPHAAGQYCTLNCPATAASLDHYLRTGSVSPAVCNLPKETIPGYGFDISMNTFSKSVSWEKAEATIKEQLKKHGDFVIVEGTRSEKQMNENNLAKTHYFSVVNVKGQLFAIDAFGSGIVSDSVPSYIKNRVIATTYRIVKGEFKVKEVIPK